MLKNAPIKQLIHNGLTIEGYSRAAVQTYWRIPELKLGFDLGANPGISWAPRRGSYRTPTWITLRRYPSTSLDAG